MKLRILPLAALAAMAPPVAAEEPLSLPDQVVRPLPYEVTRPDVIRDRWEDPRTVYQQMRTGEFDREPMDEIEYEDFEENKLPPPTVVPPALPSDPPVWLVPAQRMVEVAPEGEEKVFNEITRAEAEAQELERRLREAQGIFDDAPARPLRRIAEELEASTAAPSSP